MSVFNQSDNPDLAECIRGMEGGMIFYLGKDFSVKRLSPDHEHVEGEIRIKMDRITWVAIPASAEESAKYIAQQFFQRAQRRDAEDEKFRRLSGIPHYRTGYGGWTMDSHSHDRM